MYICSCQSNSVIIAVRVAILILWEINIVVFKYESSSSSSSSSLHSRHPELRLRPVEAAQEHIKPVCVPLNTEALPLGFQINWKKINIQTLGSSNLQDPTLTINSDTNIEVVNSFVYLGSKIVNCCSCSPEIRRRLSLAHNALGRLSNIWKNSAISSALKLRLLNAVVIPIFLYGSETWTLCAASMLFIANASAAF